MHRMDRAVILFDDDCGFCRWSLSKILAWDRRNHLRPVALQSAEADDLLGGMDPDQKIASWHLIAPDGRTYSGGEAVSHLARLLPAGAPIASLAGALGLRCGRVGGLARFVRPPSALSLREGAGATSRLPESL